LLDDAPIISPSADRNPPSSSKAAASPQPGLGASPEELKLKLWNTAFDRLNATNPGIVKAYENILSAELSGDGPGIKLLLERSREESQTQIESIIKSVSARLESRKGAFGELFSNIKQTASKPSIAWATNYLILEVGDM
jgi:hypothetical protein